MVSIVEPVAKCKNYVTFKVFFKRKFSIFKVLLKILRGEDYKTYKKGARSFVLTAPPKYANEDRDYIRSGADATMSKQLVCVRGKVSFNQYTLIQITIGQTTLWSTKGHWGANTIEIVLASFST
ncbi:hypothetical protein CDAR_391231 [Caerostris darwini]|uniref:Uncharacterized protein n=1 Tax=Caerostris darwini TaxID=1538125 RepID=A0AAV4SXB5_9ARAC|nr:hypothetical protein CDAR_391231 [Caerostris darwini]